MPIDILSGQFPTKSRTQVRDDWLRSYKLRVPSADTSEGTEPFLLASITADTIAPQYAAGKQLADGTSWADISGELLDKEGNELGRPRKDATGASGYIILEAASGGASILSGTVIKEPQRNIRFQVTSTNVYLPGDLVPIEGLDVGSVTNLDPDTQLQWVSPPPGVGPTALVFENTDGTGLTGGHEIEDDDTYREAILNLFRDPPANGNQAAYIAAVEGIAGLAVQKAWVTSAVLGAGTTMICFTMRPSEPGASRLPNGAQIAHVEAELKAQFPADDGIMVATMLHDTSQPVKPALKVKFRSAAEGYVDAVPWPPYDATQVVTSGTPTATTARVINATTAPTVGKTIAFYDSATRTFKRKRILTVTSLGGNAYDLVFDDTLNVSDTGFVPATGALVSPYALSMNDLVQPLLEYGDKQGPGEVFASFSDPGIRQRRYPAPLPDEWPHEVTERITNGLFEIGVVDTVSLMKPTPTPYGTTIGTPGTLVYLHQITDIAIYSF